MLVFTSQYSETQKPTEGTDVKSPITLGETKMAQVTYRGVKYDTDRNKAKQTNKVDLTYRGVRTEKELTSLK